MKYNFLMKKLVDSFKYFSLNFHLLIHSHLFAKAQVLSCFNKVVFPPAQDMVFDNS